MKTLGDCRCRSLGSGRQQVYLYSRPRRPEYILHIAGNIARTGSYQGHTCVHVHGTCIVYTFTSPISAADTKNTFLSNAANGHWCQCPHSVPMSLLCQICCRHIREKQPLFHVRRLLMPTKTSDKPSDRLDARQHPTKDRLQICKHVRSPRIDHKMKKVSHIA